MSTKISVDITETKDLDCCLLYNCNHHEEWLCVNFSVYKILKSDLGCKYMITTRQYFGGGWINTKSTFKYCDELLEFVLTRVNQKDYEKIYNMIMFG